MNVLLGDLFAAVIAAVFVFAFGALEFFQALF